MTLSFIVPSSAQSEAVPRVAAGPVDGGIQPPESGDTPRGNLVVDSRLAQPPETDYEEVRQRLDRSVAGLDEDAQ
ncbi:hypothetical protein [Pseudonocardia yunnanensis]|uniref:Uncharacterized protein n=1 Tax=Pseudonocardia yunnanensis TaxID=58107 RepID=A0ABW4ENA4_9PSEU